MNTIDYTISSVDYQHNNRIYTNITAPHTEYCKMTITSLTTIANFVVLGTSDYIVINEHRYNIQEDYSDVNTASLVEYLNGLVVDNKIVVEEVDQCINTDHVTNVEVTHHGYRKCYNEKTEMSLLDQFFNTVS